MTITKWPRHLAEHYVSGSLFEMQGFNLQFLPRNLVVMPSLTYLNYAVGAYVWALDSVNEEGTVAYFKLVGSPTYNTELDYSVLATPVSPLRVQWLDYDDQTGQRSVIGDLELEDDLR